MAGEDVIYELAVRLGSIVSFDRHGCVVFLDSFEDGLVHVSTLTGGDGASVAVSTVSAKSGAQSIKLTAGRGGSGFAWLEKRVHPTVAGKIGVEFSWARVPSNTIISVWLAYFPGGVYYYGGLRYHVADDLWQYFDSEADWQTLESGIVLYSDDAMYHTMKLVIDLENNEYERAMLNEFEASLPGVAMRLSTTPAGPFLLAYVDFTDEQATNPYIYVDDLIITQNEP